MPGKNNSLLLVTDDIILHKILVIRGQKVMLDSDLAELYEVETKVLKQAVRRNIDIFPEHFMFELNEEEFNNLRSQSVTSNWGGSRYLPFVFTEHGVLQLANVLRSLRARKMGVRIIEVFIKMRETLNSNLVILNKLEELERNDIEHDKKIEIIFEYLKLLEKAKEEEDEFKQRKKIGFNR